jgi:hypothetical protein
VPEFLVSVPFTLAVWVEAESEDQVDEDLVYDAIIETSGKYPMMDARSFGEFEILEETS